MTATMTRQPAGIPAGGQFAASTHAEAEVALATVPLNYSAAIQQEPG